MADQVIGKINRDDQVISKIRFSAELCGYHEVKDLDPKDLQATFARTIREYFQGRVPFGNKTPYIGITVRNSRDPIVGTAVVGDVGAFIGADGEDLERLCNGFVNDPDVLRKHPQVWWEEISDATEKARAEEKARRKEYSKKLMAGVEDREREATERFHQRRGTGTGGVGISPAPAAADVDLPEGDPEDWF